MIPNPDAYPEQILAAAQDQIRAMACEQRRREARQRGRARSRHRLLGWLRRQDL